MATRSKSQIVGEYKARIILIDEFIKAIEILKSSDVVKSYDGKKITKRFTDKIENLLPNYIKIDLVAQSWSHFLNVRLYMNREIFGNIELQKYLTYNDVSCEINQQEANRYEPADLTYCVNGIRTFNFEKFVKCAQREINLLNSEKTQYVASIEKIDDVIQKTQELQKLVRQTLAEFPSYIKPTISFNFTITDD